ncbi:hypothetical protein AC790_08820 [Pantoea sp. RIT-PI-b]|uniref:hypothetical protein n=1 Tax=Pantoea sp. RIT-PI-b TaxID=1681195 RepID=UPI00067603AD|nr:hypothetical protein [Pantoea sp. RIT-PI-b]KNC14293.1 hypothetical protein AC790_08820 [Pantoea sp. RIT-PI-b]
MTTAINAKVMASVCPKVEEYIKKNMIGSMSTSVAVQNMDDKNQSKLYLCDKDSDVGTYLFSFNEQGSVQVSDYFEEDIIFGTYGLYEGTKFNKDFDLNVKFNNIVYFLGLLQQEKANMYICIDDDMIQHQDLIMRRGWTDRRIKQVFGIKPYEFGERWYSLLGVLKEEK